jgi:phospholipase/carboxylesterase
MTRHWARREWLQLGATAFAGFACGAGRVTDSMQNGRLTARPSQPGRSVEPGRHPLGIGARGRDGFFFVPAVARDRPLPLALMLHGAGGRATAFDGLVDVVGQLGIALLAVDARGSTWDVIRGDFGPDVDFIDRALAHVFDRCSIDPARLAIGGFSDGASYALTLGLRNGDLFSHILAFSPGFSLPGDARGKPRIFISHGTSDAILPIDRTSRTIAPRLRRDGYELVYQEFDGPHTVPAAVRDQALRWLLGTDRSDVRDR